MQKIRAAVQTPDEARVNFGYMNNLIPTDWEAYSPTFSETIGNGTLTGYYCRNKELCFVSVHLLAGSTTGFGSGDSLTITLPATAATGMTVLGSALALEMGTAYHAGVALIASVGTVMSFVFDGANQAADNAVPFGWSNTDQLWGTAVYPV